MKMSTERRDRAMTTLKDRESEVGAITKRHPLHYMRVRVAKDVKHDGKLVKIGTILNGKRVAINLSVIPHVYTLDERRLEEKEVYTLKAGMEVLIPVFLLNVFDGILTVETFPGRNVYAVGKGDWDKIILEV